MSSTDVPIYVDVISNKFIFHFFQSDNHAVIPNKLAFTSLHCSISFYTFDRRDSDLINLRANIDSNKYQTKAFVVYDHKSDQTRSTTHRKQNIPASIDVSSAK